MTDAPRSKSEAKRLAIQRERTLSERIRCKGFNVSADQLADEVAALEQERDDNIKLAAKWHARAINARTEGKAQLARLREAIRELADEYDATYHDQLIAGSVVMRLRALTKGENDGR